MINDRRRVGDYLYFYNSFYLLEIIIPYIKQEDRHQIDVHRRPPLNAGELNYVFCRAARLTKTTQFFYDVCVNYLTNTRFDYQHMNDVVGALVGAYDELIRRFNIRYNVLITTKEAFQRNVVAHYEDKKIIENGDL